MFLFALLIVLCSAPCVQAELMKFSMDSPFMRSSKSAVSYVAEGNIIKIEVQLPGFGKEDIAVLIEDGTLFVRHIERGKACQNEKSAPMETEDYLAEIFLPTGLNIEQAQAVMKNGLLTIKITRAKTSALSIPVKG